MKDHPLLFQAEMVRAILAGRKTQTRRLVPNRWVRGDRLWVKETFKRACPHDDDDTVCIAYRASQDGGGGLIVNNIPRPANVPMWDEEDEHWRPSIFMPRWASRITLEVVDVRSERLNDISEADAIAEGAEPLLVPPDGGSWPHYEGYRALWESINGPGTWAQNPLVWVTTFKELK